MASKGKKVGIIIGAVFGLAAIIGGSVAAVKIIQNKNVQNQNGGTIIEYPDPEPTPEPTPTPTPDPTPDPGPIPDPGPVEITEAEYKAMFEEELPGVIESYFNENIAEISLLNISNVEVKAINNETGTIYLNCTQQGINKFMELNSESLKNAESYKNLSENINTLAFTTENKGGATVQEESLANEIASLALEQQEVLDYITENGIDISNYTVLNATEFGYGETGRVSNLTILFNDKIFTMTIGGTTGACSTQEEYLNKLKDGRLSVLTNFAITNYKELEVASAETSSETWICTLSSELGNYLQGRSVTTNSGEFQFE